MVYREVSRARVKNNFYVGKANRVVDLFYSQSNLTCTQQVLYFAQSISHLTKRIRVVMPISNGAVVYLVFESLSTQCR